MKHQIIIATTKSWNVANTQKLKQILGRVYTVHLIKDKQQLQLEHLDKIKPEFIFFPHWSWIISKKIYQKYQCVVFHMTDLPFGRGGSPLQNLIVRGKYRTKISAIKVVEKLDAGPIYLKMPFNLSQGNAETLYRQISEIIFFQMIPKILKQKIVPKNQRGKIVLFDRRQPEQSDLLTAKLRSLRAVYDFVRMLDAEDYPAAFIKISPLITIHFKNIKKHKQQLEGTFEVIYDRSKK